MQSQFELIVSGRVQGVGFRAAAKKKARYLNLRGWVENLPDGTVRVVVNGDRQKCMDLFAWCREGSAYSWVEGVQITEMAMEPLAPFDVRY